MFKQKHKNLQLRGRDPELDLALPEAFLWHQDLPTCPWLSILWWAPGVASNKVGHCQFRVWQVGISPPVDVCMLGCVQVLHCGVLVSPVKTQPLECGNQGKYFRIIQCFKANLS